MTEPGVLASQQAQAKTAGLWNEAPAWRNLTVVAVLLTVGAIALPMVSAPPSTPPVPSPPPVATPAAGDRASPTATAPAPAPAPAIQAALAQPPRRLPAPAPVPAPSVPAVAQAAQPAAQAEAQAAPAACLLTASPVPRSLGAGTVIGFEDRASSLARIRGSQLLLGGQIDPNYIDNLRVAVRLDNGSNVIFLAPKAMRVRTGDRVTVQATYRNAGLPCNYIPNLITADLGPAPTGGANPAVPAQGSPGGTGAEPNGGPR